MKRLFVLAVLVCGCGGSSSDGLAVDLTVIVDTSIDISQIMTLELDVSGAETFSAKSIPAQSVFKNRRAGIRYKPGASSGQLDFLVTAFDSGGVEVAAGSVTNIPLVAGKTSTATITLSTFVPDLGVDAAPAEDASTADAAAPDLLTLDFTLCGNGVVDTGEACDPGLGSAKPCPDSAADCDDANPCTTDSVSGAGCQRTCTHTNIADNSACIPEGSDGGVNGVCLGGACCTGCVSGGACKPGNSDAMLCGNSGADCFNCLNNSASATCTAGTCSGCDVTSCTNESRFCGTSSCGFNCGSCPDKCMSGAINHYSCVSKICQMTGVDGCPGTPANATAECSDSTTCSWACNGGFTSCAGGCIATGTGTCCISADCPSELHATVTCGSDHMCHLNCTNDSDGYPLFGDCDGNYFNGCETPLQTQTNCSECGENCTASGGCCDGSPHNGPNCNIC